MENLIWFWALSGAGLLALLGTIITLLASRGRNRAEIEKLIAETEETRLKAQGELQDQLFELIEQNKKEHADREKERDAKRFEINNLSKRIETLNEMLSNEQSRAIKLMSENAQQQKTINTLETNFRSVQEDVKVIKKVTGQLGKNAN